MAQAAPREVAGGRGWRVLLPPGWVTIPTESEAARDKIRKMIDAVMEGKPRDELVRFRIELDRELRMQVREARRAGATHVHALMRPIEGMPVSASLTTVPVEVEDVDQLAVVLSQVLGDDDGIVEAGHVDLQDRGALRRVRRSPGLIPTPEDKRQLVTTSVDYVVPLDDRTVLVLAFSTTTEPIQDELVHLFDAIATTLHRVD